MPHHDVVALGASAGGFRALSSALRALEERIYVVRRLEKEAWRRQCGTLAAQWERRARDYDQQASVIRNVLLAAPAGERDQAELEPERGAER